jgi:hypothetical protein
MPLIYPGARTKGSLGIRLAVGVVWDAIGAVTLIAIRFAVS